MSASGPTTTTVNIPPQLGSYAEVLEADWRHKKISIIGVVASFVRQLRPGQDLTRVSLPAEMLFPFSVLEGVGHRELYYFDSLCEAQRTEDPLQRFVNVVRWYVSTVQQEDFYKKPYNPVLGENYEAFVSSKEYGKSQYVAEQVSHHPPVSALHLWNEQENITFDSNITFNVRFGGNYVNVGLNGTVTLGFGARGEIYESNKFVPDMLVKNVIWGTKRIFWVGEVNLVCQKTGYSALVAFRESNNENTIRATINEIKSGTLLYELEGKCSGEIYIIDKRRGNEKKLLVDVDLVKKSKIQFPAPEERDPMNSLTIWAETSHYITQHNMGAADDAKKRIEAAQRQKAADRSALHQPWLARFFIETEDGWVFKERSPTNASAQDKNKAAAKRKKMSATPVPSDQPIPDEKDLKQNPEKSEKQVGEGRPTISSSSPSLSQNSVSMSMEQDTSEDEMDNETHPAGAAPPSPSVSRIMERGNGSPNIRAGTMATSPGAQRTMNTLNLPSRRVKRGTSVDDLRKRISPFRVDEPPLMSGWMKMRNSMKIWVNKWFVLRPGMLIYYKDKSSVVKDRVSGILRLSDCRVSERVTEKDGFSFKIEHLLHYPIYHKYGLRGETLKMAMLPVSWNYCILRVLSEQERKAWIDAINDQIHYANVHDIAAATPDAIPDDQKQLSEDDKDDQVVTDEEPLTKQEVAEDLFEKNDVGISQKAIENINEQTLKTVDEWRSEVSARLSKMEKKIMTTLEQKSEANQLTVSWWMLIILLLVGIVIGRFLL